MARAMRYGGTGVQAYGIEVSPDSAAIAQRVHGDDFVVHGDASQNFVRELGWQDKFSVAVCTAVIQHMTPAAVEVAIGNVALALLPRGKFLLTFKDSPTRSQMAARGMSSWADEIYLAELAGAKAEEAYLKDGYLRAVMWDDDYYPGVTSPEPPVDRNVHLLGHHLREFVFYSLDWIKKVCARVNTYLGRHLSLVHLNRLEPVLP